MRDNQPPISVDDPSAWQDRAAAALTLAGLAASVVLATLSEGGHHDDDLTHYLFARWAGRWPAYLLHTWGRSGFTVLYALPAQIGSPQTGWLACRLLSGVLAAATAWLAYRTARAMGLSLAWLVPAIVWVQPLFLKLSFTTLTETPMALYLAAATWLMVMRRPVASAAILSLVCVTRHEGVLFLPIWAVAMWHAKARWWAYPLLLWAPAAHSLIAWGVGEPTQIATYLQPRPNTDYGHGTGFTYVAGLMVASGAVVTALAAAGVRRTLAARGGRLIVGSVGAYLLAQTLVRVMGLYASGGYPRFLVPLAPLLGIMAAGGVEALWRADVARWRRLNAVLFVVLALIFAGVEVQLRWCHFDLGSIPQWQATVLVWAARIAVGLLAGLALLSWAWPAAGRGLVRRKRVLLAAGLLVVAVHLFVEARPYRLSPAQLACRQAAAWLRSRGYCRPGGPTIHYTNIWMAYLLNRPFAPHRERFTDRLASSPVGTIVVWEHKYGPGYVQKLSLEGLIGPGGSFHQIAQMGRTKRHDPYIHILRKVVSPSSTSPSPQTPRPGGNSDEHPR